MAKLGVTPTHKTVDDLRNTILSPSLTPYFEVQFPVPSFLSNLNSGSTFPYNYLTLLCTEAVLPGNNLITFNVDNDYTGVTEKMPHRKVYDQELQLTFYVNAGDDAYYPIRFFESYISYIAGEDPSDSTSLEKLKGANYFYKMSYPDEYMIDGLLIKKFEKGEVLSPVEGAIKRLGGTAYLDYSPGSAVNKELSYEFIRSYPTAINSMPVSYGEADVLKCTVTYSYIRYIQHNTFSTSRVEPTRSRAIASVPNTDPQSRDTTLSRSQIRQAVHPGGFSAGTTQEDLTLRGGKSKSQLRREQNPNFGKGSREDPSTPVGQIENKKQSNYRSPRSRRRR